MENPNSLEKKSAETLKPEFASADFEMAEKSSEIQEIETVNPDGSGEKTLRDDLSQISDSATVGAPGIDIKDSPLHQSVEAILEADLEDLYFEMNEQEQKLFKETGEQITRQIINLIQSAKASFNKIFKLIRNWLKIIPGVNKFFIEQEAKIKADKVINLSS
ncbi:hypothetical protein L6278_02075 [Candidatus Parcubacteria bacterium]|nr:hypothetical protein [Patescibacteria group bacterium]MBU4481831.1 hypothetical protein [Patescibacteria group bacterium]MCG2686905.1 hypothetical protein [Candidatus Parcubacteria bacterium]